MVKIVCEMCGSNNLIKQDGEYVCQHCGTKYTTEEAKKLMIEVSGKVDISGSTVKIDNAELIHNSLMNARRARSTGDWAETEKCYDVVKANDPKNAEAIVYSSYAKAMASINGTNQAYREERLKILKNEISELANNYNSSRKEDFEYFIEQLSEDIISMCSFKFPENSVSDQIRVNTYNLFKDIIVEFFKSLDIIVKKSKGEKLSIQICELIIKNCKIIRDNGRFSSQYKEIIPVVTRAYEYLRYSNPNYPELPQKFLKAPMNDISVVLLTLALVFVFIIITFIINSIGRAIG